jgi:uncharacterized membrane protein
MIQRKTRPERLAAFSDGVFAVIITILVLDLRPPRDATLDALLSLWPTAVSYGVSYLFIAIVWVNHHHLLRYAEVATSRLIWGNFAHLFTVSLIPFSTAWIASTQLAALPVAIYAMIFVLVNATYVALCGEAVDKTRTESVPAEAKRMMRMRSVATLIVFAVAALISLKLPLGGLGLICCCLFFYLRPEPPSGLR